MSTVFRRSLFFGEQDDQEVGKLYGSLCQNLQTEIVSRLGLQNNPEMLASWPNSSLSNSYGSATAVCGEWVADTRSDHRKFQVKLTEHHQADEWIIELTLGRIGEELVLYEEGTLSPPRPTIPFEEMPELLPGIHNYTSKDEDGMIAGRTYVVSNDRVYAFSDFIGSSERRLPIVLVSTSHDTSSCLLTNTTAVARRLQGLAHVIKLEEAQTSRRLLSRQPNHRCYNGAVRVFWPGFAITDNPTLHPVWLPGRFRTTEDVSAVCAEIVSVVYKESSRILTKNPDIELLERQQSEQESRERLAHLETQIREQFGIRMREQADAELAELIQEYDHIEEERDRLRTENEDLRAEISRAENKIRALRWQLNSAWQERQEPESGDSPAVIPMILLSSKARKRYDSFDRREQHYWDEHILSKLFDKQLRDNQTEPLDGPNGTCWVYPRSRTADGRRVIYYGEAEKVYVCELLTSGEHDVEYSKLRNQGVAREAYNGFEEWRLENAS